MYSVYVENEVSGNTIETCIYHDVSIDQRLKLVSPVLELEDNAAGSFQFTFYPTNQGYGTIPDTETDYVSILSSTIRIYREWTTSNQNQTHPIWHKEEVWEGRPLTEDKDFYNARAIYCEGAFSYLNDIHQPVKEYLGPDNGDVELTAYVDGVLEEYNKHAAPNRQFDRTRTYVNPVGISSLCTLKDPVASVADLPQSGNSDYDVRRVGNETSKTYYMYTTLTGWKDASKSIYHTMGSRYQTGGETTKEALSVLVSAFGGHMKVVTIVDAEEKKHRCLYYTAMASPEDDYIYAGCAPSEDRGPQQEVVFGKNLLDISKKKDGSKFFTVLLPVGAEIGSSPEAIESMCMNLIEDGTQITDQANGSDIYISNVATFFDSVSLFSTVQRNEVDSDPNSPTAIKRKVLTIDLPQEYNGFNTYLFTSSFVREETKSDDRNNAYMYRLTDRSAETSKIDDLFSGMGYGEQSASGPSEYANHRIISMKKINADNFKRDTLEGELIQIPQQGIYTFMFSVGDDYAWLANKDNDQDGRTPMPSDLSWREATPAKVLKYPKYYRAPYKRAESIQAGLRKIDILGSADSNIVYWHDTHPTDGHGRDADVTYPYNRYGMDNAYIKKLTTRDTTVNPSGVYGAVVVQANNSKNAWYLDRFYPFYGGGVDVPLEWQKDGAYDTSKLFTTGYTGHHICKVSVEPGRTYYLTTRVTNPGFPNVDAIDPVDPEYKDDPSKAIFDEAGNVKNRRFYTIIAYAVVARKASTQNPYYEVLSYKNANQSEITTDFYMEKIEIPSAKFPERYSPEGEQDHDSIQHLELWFACDQCYINGCANLDPNAGDVGYEPELYLQDKEVSSDSSTSEKSDYQDKVTVAPLQRPKTATNFDGKCPDEDDQEYADNYGFPYEYIVNREMYAKYGPIVKRSEYSQATTPEKLMEYANVEMLSMTEDPSFEVSAADLKACGIAECDTFRLMQKIKIDTEPHGVNKNVSLTKLSIDLADLSSNTYTFGYEPTSDLSAMQGEGN